jgi:transposase
MLALLGKQIEHLSEQIQELEKRLGAMHRADALSRLLETIPGVGEIIALSFAMEIDAAAFESGRHLAAWLGLTPKQHSTGGKQRLGGISRAGHERLRALLVSGAMSVIRAAERPGGKLMTEWLRQLLARKPKKVAAVALANKMARMIWAMMTSGEAYRAPGSAGAGRVTAVHS